MGGSEGGGRLPSLLHSAQAPGAPVSLPGPGPVLPKLGEPAVARRPPRAPGAGREGGRGGPGRGGKGEIRETSFSGRTRQTGSGQGGHSRQGGAGLTGSRGRALRREGSPPRLARGRGWKSRRLGAGLRGAPRDAAPGPRHRREFVLQRERRPQSRPGRRPHSRGAGLGPPWGEVGSATRRPGAGSWLELSPGGSTAGAPVRAATPLPPAPPPARPAPSRSPHPPPGSSTQTFRPARSLLRARRLPLATGSFPTFRPAPSPPPLPATPSWPRGPAAPGGAPPPARTR